MKKYYIFALFMFVVFASACHHKDEIEAVIDNSINFGNDYATVIDKLSSDSTLVESGGNIYCYGQNPYSVIAYDFEYNNLYAVTYVIPQNNDSEKNVINQRLSGFTNLGSINSLDTYYNEREHCFAVVKDKIENGQTYTVIAYTQYDPNNNNVIIPRLEVHGDYYGDSYAEITGTVSGIDGYADCYLFYSLFEDLSNPTVFHKKSSGGTISVVTPLDWRKGTYYFSGYIIYEGVRYDASNIESVLIN